MKRRNKFLKFFSACFAVSLVSVPLASCFSNNLDSRPDYGNGNDGDSGNGNDGDSGNGSSNIISKSYVEPEIKDSVNATGDLKVIDVNNNSGSEVYRSINEFLTTSFNQEEYKTKISKEMLLKDVYSYVYKYYLSNRGIFSFYYNKDTIVNMNSDDQNNITFDLSISLKILNNRYDKQVFSFEDKSVELDGYDYLILDINITNQQPKFIINTNNNRYFLGISFDDVKFNLTKSEFYIPELSKPEQQTVKNGEENQTPNDGKIEFTYNNFSFTKNSFSKIFLTEFIYLTDALDYKGALEHEQVKAYYDSLTEQEIKDSIENGFISNQDLYLEILKTANIFFSSIGANDTGRELVKKIAPSLTKILQYFNVLPQGELTYNLIEQLITNNEPVINVISKNNEVLTSIITSLISKDPFVVNLISSLLEKFDPNMTQEEKQKLKEEIKSLLNRFGAGNLTFVNSLIDVLLNNGTLFDIIQAALKEQQVVNLIKGVVGAQFSGLIDLVATIITSSSVNKPLIKIVVENVDQIVVLLSSLIGNNPTVDALLKLVLSTKGGFTEENLLNLFNKTFKALTDGILNNTTVDKKYTQFSYDKQNQKVSYQYQYDYVFNNEVTIDLTPLKKLFPTEINLKELGVDTAAIDKMVDDTAVSIPIVGKIGLKTNNDVGSEWYIFKDTENHNDIKDTLSQIPDNLTFGANDKISFSYSNSNQKIWLNPTKNEKGDWLFGIQVPFILKINLNAPSLYNKIKTDLNNKTLGEHGFNVWNEIGFNIATILSKVYSASGVVKTVSSDKVLTNFDYNDTLYMEDYNLSYNSNFDINTFNTISTHFVLESTYKHEGSNIDSYFEKNNNDLEVNKTLVQNYESLNLVKDELMFSYNALNSSNTGTDAIKDGSIQKGIKLRVPFRAKSTIGSIPTTLDLVIYVNISNFSSNIYLPFKIQSGPIWTNHLTFSKTSLSVDGVADVYLPYKLFGKKNYVHYGKVKFPLFSTLLL